MSGVGSAAANPTPVAAPSASKAARCGAHCSPALFTHHFLPPLLPALFTGIFPAFYRNCFTSIFLPALFTGIVHRHRLPAGRIVYQVRESSDVYSFGVVLLELLSGQAAYSERKSPPGLARPAPHSAAPCTRSPELRTPSPEF